MRVTLLLEQCLAPVPGGTGRYSREIAAALARTAGPPDQVHGVTAWHRDVQAAKVAGVSGPRRLPLPRRALVAVWDAGLPLAVDGDLVHAPTPLAPPSVRVPLVVTVHDAVPFTHPELLTPHGAAWHRRAIRRAAGRSALVVVPSKAVAVALADHVELPAVHVSPHGVTRTLRSPADAADRRRALQLPDRYLLAVGTLEPRKGLDILLDALTPPAGPRIALVVVGPPGWGDVDLEAESRQRGLTEVHVLGRLPDPDLAAVLAGATALVAPSRAEGFGLPVLDAMAAGVPAVTSDDPALVELGAGATLVARKDELRALLARVVTDADLRRQLADAGQARARHFDWDDAAQGLWDAYRRLVM